MVEMEHSESLDMICRLVSAMQMGVRIECRDGHRWIELTEGGCHPYDADENPLVKVLRSAGVRLNNKIYGSYRQALSVIDEALALAGEDTLLERYHKFYRRGEDAEDVFGEPFGDHRRIDEVESGCGGVV